MCRDVLRVHPWERIPNLSTSEVIDTYVYKVGLASQVPQYSYATAIGLFQSIVGLILVFTANRIARKVTSTGLW